MPLHWALWLRQIGAIFRLEIEKNFLSRRSILIYLIAMLPLFPLTILAIVRPPGGPWSDFNQISVNYAVLYNGLILRTVVFFGSAWIFMNLFRGELVDRSLHYYFLSAVRREVLVVGKYVSGLATSIILFTATTVISMLLMYFPHYYSQSMRFFTEGKGLTQLLTYAGITILACVGYGAFFLVVGSVRSQSHHSRARALWLGVAQLSDASAAEKGQRHSLSQFTGASADFGRTICSGRGTNTCVDRDSQHVGRNDTGTCPRFLPHPPHGDPLRIRLRQLPLRKIRRSDLLLKF